MIRFEKVRTYLSRVAAGIVAAALTGLFAGGVLWLYVLVTGFPPGPGSNVIAGTVYVLTMSTIFGAVFGAPSAILVMCFSRARVAAWRSIPILVTGATIGIATLGLPWGLLSGTTASSIAADVMCIVGPTIGGIFSLRFLPRQQPSTPYVRII